jgi:tetratricopeptide (TPR) repeat protein
MVHVPFTTPAKSSVTTLDNAAVELAETENAETETDNGSIIDEEPRVEGLQENRAAAEENPEAVLDPNPEPRRIDMKARVETTRYLLQDRKAYMSENYDSAITALRRAIELNPFSSQAFAMLGSIYYRLGWNRMALENWQHALELDPTNEGLKKYLMRLSR